MGIQVEFNPDLCLRAYGTPVRTPDECLPDKMIPGEAYHFEKKGQRNYWLGGEIPLRETKGNQQLSRPLASIRILSSTHELTPSSKGTEVWTTGEYYVIRVFDPNDPTVHFEGMERTE